MTYAARVFDFETFEGAIGDEVSMSSPTHGVVAVRVVEVEKAAGDRPDNAFSVLFKGPLDRFLEQMTYDTTIGEHGTHPLFVVPVNQLDDGYVYEAVFTRVDD